MEPAGGAVCITHRVPSVAEIWAYVHNTLLKKYAFMYDGINVVAGPVFDYNYDGRHDAPEQIQQ